MREVKPPSTDHPRSPRPCRVGTFGAANLTANWAAVPSIRRKRRNPPAAKFGDHAAWRVKSLKGLSDGNVTSREQPAPLRRAVRGAGRQSE